jgi:hypothetical protein
MRGTFDMRFDENGICVLESCNRVECDAYVEFLLEETLRHKDALDEAEDFMDDYSPTVMYGQPTARTHALYRFWDSAAERHRADLKAIDKRLKEIHAYKETL